jgi:hypothetical protein
MLPILPALLLLLFQGPAHFERSLGLGRLPAEVQHLHHSGSRTDSEAIAQLIAAGNDPELTQALFAIFRWIDRPAEPAPVSAPIQNRPTVAIDAEPPGRLAQGFAHSARTRDGPFAG